MSMKMIANALYWLYRARVPTLLEGVHGIGKTSILYQLHARIRKELKQSAEHEGKSTLDGREIAKMAHVGPNEFGLWACSAANLTIEELIGYPRPREDGRGIEYLRSFNFLPPPDHKGGGIWDIDELNLASAEVERALMSVMLEGRYLDYVMPEGIFIVTSQNPATGEYHSRRLNPPTLNRFCQIKVVADATETISHFMNRGFHASILDCVSEHSEQVLNPHQNTIDFKIEQQPTSRSWEYVDRALKVATKEEISTLGLAVFSGLLGASAGAVFQKFAEEQGERSIPIDEVLADYGYDEETYDPDSTCHKEWPVTKIRRRVMRVCHQASVRADIINIALSALAQRLRTIAEAVREQSNKAGRGGIIEAMTGEQKRQIINALAFLCDLPPDQCGPPFMRQIKSAGFQYTFKPLSRHTICNDYHKHWERVNVQSLQEAQVTSE